MQPILTADSFLHNSGQIHFQSVCTSFSDAVKTTDLIGIRWNCNRKNMNKKIDLKFIGIIFIATFFSYFLHEFGHWIVGELLGNNMIMQLNGAYPESGRYVNDWNTILVFLGGPIITISQALLAFFLIKKYQKLFIYPFLFFLAFK